eukprot:scaffold24837_cov84-Cyclotella_meneghiniana.AAC.1
MDAEKFSLISVHFSTKIGCLGVPNRNCSTLTGLPEGCDAPAAASGGVQWPSFVQPPHCEGGFSSTQTMPRKIAL